MQTTFSAQVDIFYPKISAVLRKMEFVNSQPRDSSGKSLPNGRRRANHPNGLRKKNGTVA
jgi:hypothetical protein